MFYSNSGNFLKKNRLLFFLFFAFGALFYFVSYFMVFNGQGKRVASNIEFGYKKAQESFGSHIQRIETLVSSGSTAALFENDWLSQTPEELGFVVMVREDDSLVYWNSSMVSLPDFQVQSTNPLDTLMHLNNGYYQIYVTQNDKFEISLLSLVYSDYAYENTYLENKFSERFSAESNRFKLQTEIAGEYIIHNLKGNPVFSITEDKDKPTTIISYIYNLFLLVVWISVINILLLNYMRYIFTSTVNPVKRIVTFFASLIFVRLLLELSNKLLGLNESDLFNASYFSFGFLFPSIGDLILNIQTLLFLAIAFARYGRVESSQVLYGNKFLAGSLVFAIIIVFYLNIFFVEQILFHSSIALSFSALYNFEALSYLLLIVLVLITLSFFLVIYRLSVLLFQVTDNFKMLSFIILIQCVVIQLVNNIISDFGFLPTIFLIAYFLLAMYNRSKSTMQNRFVFFVLVIGLFSILLTSLFYQVNQHKSDSEQMLTAYKLGLEKDPMFEFLYADMATKIAVDTTIRRMMDETNPELSNEDVNIVNYLKKKYFTGYFERYVIEATVCGQFEDLNIQPENYVVNCNKYFTETIESSGTETDYPGLFYMEDNEQGTYYISQIVIPQRNGISATIFIEFYFKYIPEGLG
ncbi:MAG: hypothetical protein HOO86_05000, partial [Bacteroidales bacterium]|nr:hypothetical protein [Bacteroidales bacterium]